MNATSIYAAGSALSYELDPRALEKIKADVDAAPVRPDRDLNPNGYRHGLTHWAERASPETARLLERLWSAPAWSIYLLVLLVPTAGVGLALAAGGRGAAATAAGASGFVAMVVEIGLISPPVGMNLFVINALLPQVPTRTLFHGVLPFMFADVIRLGILIAFPVISLWLPSLMR